MTFCLVYFRFFASVWKLLNSQHTATVLNLKSKTLNLIAQ